MSSLPSRASEYSVTLASVRSAPVARLRITRSLGVARTARGGPAAGPPGVGWSPLPPLPPLPPFVNPPLPPAGGVPVGAASPFASGDCLWYRRNPAPSPPTVYARTRG